MEVPHEAVLLRIFTSTADRCGMEPLYLAIVARARQHGLAGATVLRGSLGFGRSAQLHQGHLWPLAQDLPVVIEIVDSEDKITRFLLVLDEIMESGMVTMERAQVLHYGRQRMGLFARIRQQFHPHPPSTVEPQAGPPA